MNKLFETPQVFNFVDSVPEHQQKLCLILCSQEVALWLVHIHTENS